MAQTTFSIGATAFAALQLTSGRKALTIRPTAPLYDIKRFHPAGTEGQYLIRCGRLGKTFLCRARYIGKLLDVLGWIKTDHNAWANAAQTLTDADGTTYASCNLIGFTRATDPVYIRTPSSDRFVFIDINFDFTWDGGAAL